LQIYGRLIQASAPNYARIQSYDILFGTTYFELLACHYIQQMATVEPAVMHLACEVGIVRLKQGSRNEGIIAFGKEFFERKFDTIIFASAFVGKCSAEIAIQGIDRRLQAHQKDIDNRLQSSASKYRLCANRG
jgi:hypothetical protein